MTFTPAEQASIDAHAAALRLSVEEYIRRAAVDRAVAWQREQDSPSGADAASSSCCDPGSSPTRLSDRGYTRPDGPVISIVLSPGG